MTIYQIYRHIHGWFKWMTAVDIAAHRPPHYGINQVCGGPSGALTRTGSVFRDMVTSYRKVELFLRWLVRKQNPVPKISLILGHDSFSEHLDCIVILFYCWSQPHWIVAVAEPPGTRASQGVSTKLQKASIREVPVDMFSFATKSDMLENSADRDRPLSLSKN
jgi:hypothetical protein